MPQAVATCSEDVQPARKRAKASLMAGWTGLEPAASGVTGRRSNQLNYHPNLRTMGVVTLSWVVQHLQRPPLARGENWWAVQGSNLRQPACKAGALPLS